MKLKRDKKFGEQSTCHLKICIRNLSSFDMSARKSQRFSHEWAPYEKSIILFKPKKYRGVILHENEEGYKIWRGIDSSFQNWHKEFDKI